MEHTQLASRAGMSTNPISPPLSKRSNKTRRRKTEESGKEAENRLMVGEKGKSISDGASCGIHPLEAPTNLTLVFHLTLHRCQYSSQHY